MLECLRFIFSDFATFLGTVILIITLSIPLSQFTLITYYRVEHDKSEKEEESTKVIE